MRNGYLDPAYTVIQKLGGLQNAAKASGVSENRVWRWQLPRKRGGTDGLVPTKRQQLILDWAARHNVDLRPADFFVDRPQRRGDARANAPA
jgi:hypothetical protein